MTYASRALLFGLACSAIGCLPPEDSDSIVQYGLPRLPKPYEEGQGVEFAGDRVGQAVIEYKAEDPFGKPYKALFVVDNTLEADPGNGVRVRGELLKGSIIYGSGNLRVRIDSVTRPGETVDSENVGTVTRTYLYKLSASRNGGGWEPFCDSTRDFVNTNVWTDPQIPVDPALTEDENNLRRSRLEWAMPVASLWNYSTGAISSLGGPEGKGFTFACMGGVIAKCQRENMGGGYHAWRAYHGLTPVQTGRLLQTCTRAFRADYCGDGTVMTIEGTPINIFDNYGVRIDDSPQPPQIFPGDQVLAKSRAVGTVDGTGLTKSSIFGSSSTFEAAWTPDGARCLSHTRWAVMTPQFCKVPSSAPFTDVDGGHVCDSVQQANQLYPDADIQNESDHFPLPPQWGPVTLSVTRQAVNNPIGAITSTPAGITCGADCSQSYNQYSWIKLSAPTNGPQVQWTGCSSLQGRDCWVDMKNTNHAVTAQLSCPNDCYGSCVSSCLGSFGFPWKCSSKCTLQCQNCGAN